MGRAALASLANGLSDVAKARGAIADEQHAPIGRARELLLKYTASQARLEGRWFPRGKSVAPPFSATPDGRTTTKALLERTHALSGGLQTLVKAQRHQPKGTKKEKDDKIGGQCTKILRLAQGNRMIFWCPGCKSGRK